MGDDKLAEIKARCVPQTKFGMEGNCFSACIASILGLSIEQVPEFTEEAGGWFYRWQVWLKQYGLHLEISSAPMPGLTIADVPSPTMEGQRHSVVAYNGEIIWNPLPPHTQTWKPEEVFEWIYFTIHDPRELTAAQGRALTPERARRLMACHDALIKNDNGEAYHELLWFCDSYSDDPYKHFKEIERLAAEPPREGK